MQFCNISKYTLTILDYLTLTRKILSNEVTTYVCERGHSTPLVQYNYCVTAPYRKLRPTTVASFSNLWPKSAEIFGKYLLGVSCLFEGVFWSNFLFRSAKAFWMIVFFLTQHPEHSVLREHRERLNVSGTSQFLPKVVAATKHLGEADVFRAIQ